MIGVWGSGTVPGTSAIAISYTHLMRGADLQRVTFAAHGLNQDGQVHFATAHYAEGIVGGGLFHTQDVYKRQSNSCTESRAMSWKPGQGRDAKEHPLAANPKRAFPASKGAAPPRVKTAAFQR